MRAPARVHDWVRLDCAGSADLDWVGSTARSTIVSPLASRCRSPSRPAFVRTSPRLYREADRDGTDHPLILLFFFCPPSSSLLSFVLCLSSSFLSDVIHSFGFVVFRSSLLIAFALSVMVRIGSH
jgi:hypothetical protein